MGRGVPRTRGDTGGGLREDVSGMTFDGYLLGRTLQVIGEAIGGKNHSTVNYSISLVEKKMRSEPSFKNTVFEIIHNLQE